MKEKWLMFVVILLASSRRSLLISNSRLKGSYMSLKSKSMDSLNRIFPKPVSKQKQQWQLLILSWHSLLVSGTSLG